MLRWLEDKIIKMSEWFVFSPKTSPRKREYDVISISSESSVEVVECGVAPPEEENKVPHKKKRKTRVCTPYKCRVCGKPKRNHVCISKN